MSTFFDIKKILFSLLFVALIFAIPFSVRGQKVSVQTQVDKKEILIGDQVNLQFKVNFDPQKFRVQFPSIADTFNKYEVVERQKIDTSNQRDFISLTQNNVITNFDSGVWVIPSQPFLITPLDGTNAYEILSDSIAIKVNTVAVDTSKPIKPIFDIIAAKKSWWDEYKFWIYLLLGLLVLGGIIFFLLKKLRNRDKKPTIDKKMYVTPWDNALQKIQSLTEKELWLNGDEKEHHTQLTDIIRTYLEDVFGLDCFEKTSQEIVTDVKKYLQKNKYKKRGDELEKLRNIFFIADLVKFAKSKPTIEEHEQSNEDATAFVKNTADFLNVQQQIEKAITKKA